MSRQNLETVQRLYEAKVPGVVLLPSPRRLYAAD